MSLITVSVELKQRWTMLRHWSQFVPNMSTDIRGHEALHHHRFEAIVNTFQSGQFESSGSKAVNWIAPDFQSCPDFGSLFVCLFFWVGTFVIIDHEDFVEILFFIIWYNSDHLALQMDYNGINNQMYCPRYIAHKTHTRSMSWSWSWCALI